MIFAYLVLVALGIWAVTWLCSLDVVENFVEFFAWPAGALILGGLAVPVFGTYRWLKSGEWESIPVYRALDWLDALEPAIQPTQWLGVDKLAVRYLESSAGWTLLVGGTFISFCVSYWFDQGETRRRAKKMREEIEPAEKLN